jgi:hypothetical protein
MIKIHCDNGDDFRLARVLVSVFTRAGEWNIPDAHSLGELRHHGGTLTATYAAAPSEKLKDAVSIAWKGENESEVEHVVRSEY